VIFVDVMALLLCVQADDVLVCGCGNSELSAHMYDAGFTRITNVDSSRVAIDMMQDKYTQQEYPGMTCKWQAFRFQAIQR
jgi:2-polyprenyl-3-methyl-5-hydroxy-6-metoxy-1,4-benzoquinol methylase